MSYVICHASDHQWMIFGIPCCCMNSAVDRSLVEFHASKYLGHHVCGQIVNPFTGTPGKGDMFVMPCVR